MERLWSRVAHLCNNQATAESLVFWLLILTLVLRINQSNKPDIAEDCSSQQEHCAWISFNNSIRWIMSPQDGNCQEQQQRYQRSHALNEVSHLSRLVFIGTVKIVKDHRKVRHGSAVQNCFKEMSTSEAVGWQRNLPDVITEEPADSVHRDRTPHSEILKWIWKWTAEGWRDLTTHHSPMAGKGRLCCISPNATRESWTRSSTQRNRIASVRRNKQRHVRILSKDKPGWGRPSRSLKNNKIMSTSCRL